MQIKRHFKTAASRDIVMVYKDKICQFLFEHDGQDDDFN